MEENKKIELIDIIKLQHWYIEVFEEEDSDYVNYKRVGAFNRCIQRTLNKITKNPEERNKIYNIIIHETWNVEDKTFKPICDELRKLGYEIINTYNEKQKEKKAEYYKKHKEEKLEYQRKYAKNNKEKVLKNNRKYKERHKEEIREKKKQWYENNKEKILEQQKEYRKRKKLNPIS